MGQDDCEKLGGIFYFRILWFNVGLSSTACSSSQRTACYAVRTCVQRERKHITSARCCNCTMLLGAPVRDQCLHPGFEYGWTR